MFLLRQKLDGKAAKTAMAGRILLFTACALIPFFCFTAFAGIFFSIYDIDGAGLGINLLIDSSLLVALSLGCFAVSGFLFGHARSLRSTPPR
jgi:hypothetical protein